MSKVIEMMGADVGARLEDLLRLAADPTRMDLILLFLEKPEWNAGELAQRFSVGRATVSHHANLLVRGQVLSVRREGKERYYRLRKDEVVALLEAVTTALRNCC